MPGSIRDHCSPIWRLGFQLRRFAGRVAELGAFCNMKVGLVLLSALVAGGFLAANQWHLTNNGASPEAILGRADLGASMFEYSWTGGFSFGNSDVRASFTGDGHATLQVGDRKPIHIRVGQQRYRELLQCLASNHFGEIGVRRRWGVYLNDIGKYTLALHDGARRTVVRVDEKHYVAKPELLEPILDKVYSFEAEFGTRLDHGPLGMAATRDTREIILCISVAAGCLAVGVVRAILLRRRRRGNAEACAASDGCPTERLGHSGVMDDPPSVN